MAMANNQEAQTYLKFLPLLHDLPKQPFFIVYDPEADVLYIDFNNPPNLPKIVNSPMMTLLFGMAKLRQSLA
jgi:hypothetical protein